MLALMAMVAAPAGGTAGAGIPYTSCSAQLQEVLGMVNQIPAGASVLLNVSYLETNAPDFGNVGLWALDTGFSTFKAWLAPDGTGYVLQTCLFNWRTFQGAWSPGLGVVEPRDGEGTGRAVFFFPALFTFTPESMLIRGSPGTFDGGGTKAGILLGTYALQTIPPAMGQITSPPLAVYFNNDVEFYYLGFHGAEDYFSEGNLVLCASYTGSALTQVGDIVT